MINRRNLILSAALGLSLARSVARAQTDTSSVTSKHTGATIDWSHSDVYRLTDTMDYSNQEEFTLSSTDTDSYISIAFYEIGLWGLEHRYQSYVDMANNTEWQWQIADAATDLEQGYFTVQSAPKERITYIEYYADAYQGFDLEVNLGFHTSSWPEALDTVGDVRIDDEAVFGSLHESNLEALFAESPAPLNFPQPYEPLPQGSLDPAVGEVLNSVNQTSHSWTNLASSMAALRTRLAPIADVP